MTEMNQIAAASPENLTIPVKLAVWAMRMFPRFVSPDDTAHAAFFEPAHLQKFTQEQIHAAMHQAAHDRRIAEEQNPFLEPFFSRSVEDYFRGKEVLDFGCEPSLRDTALCPMASWNSMFREQYQHRSYSNISSELLIYGPIDECS